MDPIDRITFDPNVMGGKPCLRGLRVTVGMIVPDEGAAFYGDGGRREAIGGLLAAGRMGEPEDLVGMCLFLLSDQAKWITGQIFNVDGGQIIR